MVYSRVEEMGNFCSFLNKKCTDLYYMPDSDMHCLICRSTCVTRHASFQRRTMWHTYSRKRHNKLMYV